MMLKLLSFFFFFVMAAGELRYRPGVEKYYKCWTKMNCNSGPMAQKMKSCMSLMTPEDQKFIFTYTDENCVKIPDLTASGLLSEYCSLKGDKQKELYSKLTDNMKSIDKVANAHSAMDDFHSRAGDAFDCALNYLEKNFPDDDC